MEQLPQSVRDQLARSQGSYSDHLDADQLTAFAENSVTSAERDRILGHLAHCSECREILFLSHPETAMPQTVLRPAKSARTRWVAVAGFIAAVIAVGALFLIRREPTTNKNAPTIIASETRPQQQELEPASPPAAQTGLRDSKKTAPKLSTQAPIANERESTDLYKKDLPNKPESKPAEPPREGDELLRADAAIAKDAMAEKQSEPIIAAGAPRPSTQGPASNSANNISNIAVNDSAPAAAPMAKASRKMEVEQPPIGATDKTFSYGTLARLKTRGPRPTWRITESGSLEKSYDSKTWTQALPGGGTKFRVVSVVGGTVWAGGEQGALFVSNDEGASWARVHLGTTETVSSIQFTDEVKGVLKTTAGSTWRTTDGGITWNRH